MSYDFSSTKYSINTQGDIVHEAIQQATQVSGVDHTIASLSKNILGETAVAKLATFSSKKIEKIISLAEACEKEVSGSRQQHAHTLQAVLVALREQKKIAEGRESATVIHEPAQAAPSPQRITEMTQAVTQVLNDIPTSEPNTLHQRQGVLVVAQGVTPATQEKKQLSTEEQLLQAARGYSSTDFAKNIRALHKSDAATSIQKVLSALAKEGDLGPYCFACSELIKNVHHVATFKDRTSQLKQSDIQDELKKVIQYYVRVETGEIPYAYGSGFVSIGDPQKLPDNSLKDFFKDAKERSGSQFINQVVTSWAAEGKHELYFQALNELASLYDPKHFNEVIDKTAPIFLNSLQATGDGETYGLYIQKLSALYPNIGRFTFENAAGVPQPAPIQLAIKLLQSKGIIRDRLSDILKAMKPDDAHKSAQQLLRAIAKTNDPALHAYAVSELIIVNPLIATFVTPLGSLTLDGVRVILKKLQDQGNIAKDLPWDVYDTMKECATAIQKKIQDPLAVKFAVVICPEDIHPHHVMPIYFEKDAEGWKAVVSDSLGGSNYLLAALRMVHTASGGKVKLCRFHEKRQYSDKGCPVFTILDIAQLSKIPNCMQSLWQHKSYHGFFSSDDRDAQSIDAFYVDLPLSMKRPLQSLSGLKRKIQELEQSSKRATNEWRKASYEEELAQAKKEELEVKRHVVSVLTAKGVHERNMLAYKRFCKYAGWFVEDALQHAQTT